MWPRNRARANNSRPMPEKSRPMSEKSRPVAKKSSPLAENQGLERNLCICHASFVVFSLTSVGIKDFGKKYTKCLESNLLQNVYKGQYFGGRDESKRREAESQWIVAARPLCHLQYPVAYLSRLQRILPVA
jgi:hypothetical protein